MASYNFENAQQTMSWPYGVAVARGDVPKMSNIDKFGKLPSSTTAHQTIWDGGGVYAYPTSAITLDVTSAAGADDNGVEVTLIGLDTNYEPLEETVTLAGTGTATTTGEFLRIFRAFVSNGQASTDDIGITNGAVTYAAIVEEYQQTLMAVYTVPKGKRAYLVAANISVEKAQEVEGLLMVRVQGGVMRAQGLVTTYATPFQRVWQIPPVFNEKTDIEIRASAGATTAISAGFELLLEDK
jgi:hypothetical protein